MSISLEEDFYIEYDTYLFNCHCEGDIWNTDYRPYTYDEWLRNDKPMQGGIKIK